MDFVLAVGEPVAFVTCLLVALASAAVAVAWLVTKVWSAQRRR